MAEDKTFVLDADKVAEKVTEMPNIRVNIRKSKDGKFVIHTTEITTIRPVSYWEKVMASEAPAPKSE